MYSTYVVFPIEDDISRAWVAGILIPRVEQGLQKPQMFVKGRDDIGGEFWLSVNHMYLMSQ
jgi:hypothetical protein